MASKTYDCNITNIHIDFAGFTIPPPPFLQLHNKNIMTVYSLN